MKPNNQDDAIEYNHNGSDTYEVEYDDTDDVPEWCKSKAGIEAMKAKENELFALRNPKKGPSLGKAFDINSYFNKGE